MGQGCSIERPKLLYPAARRQWVIWMLSELPDNYSETVFLPISFTEAVKPGITASLVP